MKLENEPEFKFIYLTAEKLDIHTFSVKSFKTKNLSDCLTA